MQKKFSKRLLWLFLALIPTLYIAQNSNITLLGNLPYPGQTLANVYGYSAGGKEYALCGASHGLSIVDVTNPTSPVQIVQIPSVSNLWREVSVYSHYAYVVTEGSGGTLQIIDLNNLPDSVLAYHTYSGDGAIAGQLLTAHTLYIDTVKKFVYLFGSNTGGGALVLDISIDPFNPVYAGAYNQDYVHSGYVSNDTLYAANIYQGYFSVIDFRNKANPVLLQTEPSPGTFTHSTWLSDNRKTLFTTDEKTGAFLTSYDISDLQNIAVLDKFRSNPGSGSIPHEVHILHDWAVDSWYRDGAVIVDAHRPQNLVEVGNYETYPGGSGNGMMGAWGIYPYLPSGNLLVSNINEGLFILSPTYKRACYLEGTVTDSTCHLPVPEVVISLDSVVLPKIGELDGSFRTGTSTPGIYSVTFSKSGYVSKTITGVSLSPGNVSTLHIQLYQPGTLAYSGHLQDSLTGANISGACLQFSGPDTIRLYTDSSGNYNSCAMKTGTYSLIIGKWGYKTRCINVVNIAASTPFYSTTLSSGYYDDFSINTGWRVSGSFNAPWILSTPRVAYDSLIAACPGNTIAGTCADQAYITNNAGGNAWMHDVDQQGTTLTSPLFDLTGFKHPVIEFDRWFYNGGYRNGSPNDTMIVWVNKGTEHVRLQTIDLNSAGNGAWIHTSISLPLVIGPGPGMQVSFQITDYPPDNIVEGGVGLFQIRDSLSFSKPFQLASGNYFQMFPNPFTSVVSINYDLSEIGGSGEFQVYDIGGKLVSKVALSQTTGTFNFTSDLPEGIYLVRIKTTDYLTAPEKLIRIR